MLLGEKLLPAPPLPKKIHIVSHIGGYMHGGRVAGSCLLWVMSTEIRLTDIAVDIAVDSRSIVGR